MNSGSTPTAENAQTEASPFGDLAALLDGVLGSDPNAALAQLTGGIRSDLAAARYEGVAGGGAVRLAINGEKRLLSVTIAAEVFEAGDVATLEELIVAASSDAFETADAADRASLSGLHDLFGKR